jgi:hypothetical protein
MNEIDVNVIWRMGGDEMPDAVQKVVTEVRGDLLLRTLELPNEVVEDMHSSIASYIHPVKDRK